MIDRNALKVLESDWVRPKVDDEGKETWGYELIEGAPDDIRQAFEDVMDSILSEQQDRGETNKNA